MIRRSPAEYYIKYLLCHPENYSDEDVERALNEHHLDNPGGGYLPRLRRQVERPQLFFPFDELHFESYRFLTRHKIVHMFHPDPAMGKALKILETPRAKELVEAMVMTQDPDLLICHRLESLGLRVKQPDIRRYCHYFWNLALVDSTELRALIEMRFKQTMFDGAEGLREGALALAHKKAGWMDSRWLAANAPDPRVGSMMNHIRQGFMPPRLDVAKLVSSTASLAVLRARNELDIGSPDSPMRARDYGVVATGLFQLLEQIGAPDDELRKEIIGMGIELQHSQQQVPSVQELTQGNFTADMQIVREENNDE